MGGKVFSVTGAPIYKSFFYILSLTVDLFSYYLYKMVDDKSKLSIMRHIQMYIAHEDEQYNTHAM